MTFTRTNSGRSNLAAFLGVKYIIYSEGGEFDKTLGKNRNSIDAIFWKGVFSRFFPDLDCIFRPMGSKVNLLPFARDIKDSKISNSIVVMDRDHDHHRNCLIVHPSILYTYGYSWENDAWRAELIISKLERISDNGVSAEVAENIRGKCRNFFIDFNRLVYVDVLCSLARVQGVHREKFWAIVDSRNPDRLKVKKEAFKTLISGVKANRVNPFRYVGNERVIPERDCYGKLLSMFLYNVFTECFKSVTGQKNLSREMADVMVAEHFQYANLSADSDVVNYYAAAVGSLSASLQ